VRGRSRTTLKHFSLIIHMVRTSRLSILQLALALVLAGGFSPASAQEPPLKSAGQSEEPSVKSLFDVKPGISRTAVLAGLASDYLLSKMPLPQESTSLGIETWIVTSKEPPYRSATISFIQGKTTSIDYSLFTSESPEVVKFADALQSAIYDSASLPTVELAVEQMREIMRRYPSGGSMTDAQLAAAAQAQLGIWKLMNQRFAVAGITASQGHNEVGEQRDFTIEVFAPGGRTFRVKILTMAGRTSVYLGEVKQ